MVDPVSELIAELSADNAEQRGGAAQALCRLGEDARAAAVPLIRSAGDADETVREWATAALEELGPPSVDDRDAVAALLTAENADIGYWAATLLGRLQRDAAPAVGVLQRVLEQSPHTIVRQRAAWALGQVGPAAAEAVSSLEQAAASEDPRLARLADRALQQIRE